MASLPPSALWQAALWRLVGRLRPPYPALPCTSLPTTTRTSDLKPHPPIEDPPPAFPSSAITGLSSHLSLQRAVDVHFWEAAILGGCADPCFLPFPSRSTLLAKLSDWSDSTNRNGRTISRPLIGRNHPPGLSAASAPSLQLIIFNRGFASQFFPLAASSWL